MEHFKTGMWQDLAFEHSARHQGIQKNVFIYLLLFCFYLFIIITIFYLFNLI